MTRMNKTRKKFRTYLIIAIASGIVMVVSPFIGLLRTVGGMTRAFERMGTSGISDPGMLSSHIGEVLVASAAGLVVALVGLPVFVLFLILAIVENRRMRMMLAPPSDVTSQRPP